MDTKRLLTMMIVSFVVIMGWQLAVVHFLGPPRKIGGTPTTTTAPSSTTQVATTQEQPTSTTGPAPTTQAPPQLTQAAVHVVSAATQPTIATIGVDAAYPMVVKISSAGAGLEAVTLKEFKNPQRTADYKYQEPYRADDPLTRSLATRSIVVNGTEVSLAGVNWTLESESANAATFVVDLGPVRVRKVYEVRPGVKVNDHFTVYDLLVRHEVENTSAAAAKVKLTLNGTNTPPHEAEQGRDIQVLCGYNNDQRVALKHHYSEEFDTKHPSLDLTKGDNNTPLLWAGTGSTYFNAIIRPEPLDPTTVDPQYIENLTFASLNPESQPLDRLVATTFQIKEQTIEPGKSLVLPSTVFLGPHWRAVLKTGKYAQFPLDYDETLVMTSGPCGYCAFPFLINWLVALLGFFHGIFKDWGLAIISLVLLVRLILHPITKRSQVSMMKMGKLGPEVEKLKKKYGDDKDELNKQMMALYKDQGIGMYLGCAPMFLQMPIWIALWSALQSTFELRQAPFLYGWTWIHDLSKPDALIKFHQAIPLVFGWHLSAINVLPLLMMVVTWINQKYMPQPAAATPEQEQQQKMMKWMSMIFPLMFYNFPSGLNLYYVTSMGLGIIESKRIRAHIKEREEAEKAGKIFVDAPKAMKKGRDDEKLAKKPEPKRGIAGWLEQLQAKAEELKNQADKNKK